MANKKRLVASFHNLSPELQEEIKQKYPLGFTDAMIRIEKPNGDFFYAVPYDTDQISYLVKIDVKIDDLSEDEEEKEFYDDEIKGADDIQEESRPDRRGDGRRRGDLTLPFRGALPDCPDKGGRFFISCRPVLRIGEAKRNKIMRLRLAETKFSTYLYKTGRGAPWLTLNCLRMEEPE